MTETPIGDAVLRTLVLTDLVDSTKLVEALGDRTAAEVFARVDRLTRDLLARHDGREIDRTDGFLMLFERPLPAVAFALDLHAALEALSSELGQHLVVRAGIHLGEVFLRENSPDDVARGAKPLEVEGLAKPRAARLMALATGGQTLLTQTAFEVARRAAVGRDDTADLRWQSHGPYLFHGISEPVAVFEVARQGTAPLAPPPDTAKASRAGPATAMRPPRWAWLAAAVGVALGLAWWWMPGAPVGPRYLTVDAFPHVSDDPVLQAQYERAAGEFMGWDHEAAAITIQTLLTQLPGEPSVQTLGVAIHMAHQTEVPSEQIEAALAAIPSDPHPDRELLAFVERWMVEGWDPAKLRAEIHDLVEAHPEHVLGHLIAYAVDLQTGQTPSATEHALALLDHPSPPVMGYAMAVEPMVYSGRFSELRERLRDGRERHPGVRHLVHASAAVELVNGDPTVALALARRLLADDPSDTESRAMVAHALIRLGRADEAASDIELLTSELVPAPYRAGALFTVAEAYWLAGQRRAARRYQDQALAIVRAFGNPHYVQGAWSGVLATEVMVGFHHVDELTALIERMRADLAKLAGERALRDEADRLVREAEAVAAFLRGDRAPAVRLRDEIAASGSSLGLLEYLAAEDGPEQRLSDLRNSELGLRCRDELFVGHYWLQAGHPELARPVLESGLRDGCPDLDLGVLRGLAHADLAKLAHDAGDLEVARTHADAFRALWPHADADLPASVLVAEVEAGPHP